MKVDQILDTVMYSVKLFVCASEINGRLSAVAFGSCKKR